MRKIKEANFEKMLRDGEFFVPLLDIRVTTLPPGGRGDAIVDIAWRGQSCCYVAALKRDAKPQTLKLAVDQVKQYAQESGRGKPLIIAPYLRGDKLDQLLHEGVSALDFCGNAAIEGSGRFLFYKTGNPNRYADSSPIRSAYRGDGSLVARVLLLKHEFQAIGDILASIKEHGGSLTMGTVSKVVQRLESDLVIERPSRKSVRLIQSDRLLEALREAYQPPKIESTWMGKVTLSTTELLHRLEERARESDLVRTGESSAGDYATWAGEPLVACYCRTLPAQLLQQLNAPAKETRGFANLRLLQTADQRVYFDRRPQLAASPIQSWLEMASGDKRQKEVAEQIRSLLRHTGGVWP